MSDLDQGQETQQPELPLELWSLIVPHQKPLPPLAIRGYSEQLDILDTLRALSETCRALRAIALPRLWRFVEVTKVSELGRLRESWRISPDLAHHVRSFVFEWNLEPGLAEELDVYPSEHGSLLDLAFADRHALWSQYRELGEPSVFDDQGEGGQRCYEVGGKDFYQPMVPNGPDCAGPDEHIHNPDELIACIVEVVEKLPSLLQSFKWLCHVMPMPAGVFRALRNLGPLTTLHVHTTLWRNNAHVLPYWELVSKVQDLSLDLDENYAFDAACLEQSEEELAFWEPPAKYHLYANEDDEDEEDEEDEDDDEDGEDDEHERNVLSFISGNVLTRTIITAARSGHLKELDPSYLHTPFAIRTLLPCWVRINLEASYNSGPLGWLGAAQSLRWHLSHASLWLETAVNARASRMLTGEQVRSLCGYFEAQGLPFSHQDHVFGTDMVYKHPIERYLTWLEDLELAEQVAQAWNEVVERGEADTIRCICERCKAWLM